MVVRTPAASIVWLVFLIMCKTMGVNDTCYWRLLLACLVFKHWSRSCRLGWGLSFSTARHGRRTETQLTSERVNATVWMGFRGASVLCLLELAPHFRIGALIAFLYLVYNAQLSCLLKECGTHLLHCSWATKLVQESAFHRQSCWRCLT